MPAVAVEVRYVNARGHGKNPTPSGSGSSHLRNFQSEEAEAGSKFNRTRIYRLYIQNINESLHLRVRVCVWCSRCSCLPSTTPTRFSHLSLYLSVCFCYMFDLYIYSDMCAVFVCDLCFRSSSACFLGSKPPYYYYYYFDNNQQNISAQ